VILLIRRLGTRFWLGLWAGIVVLGGAVVFVKPLVIDPVFNEFRALEPGELRTRITALSEEAGIDVEEIYVMDASTRTKGVNAYFTGILTSSRIVLYDTLLERSSDREIISIMGHEAGHWHHRHIPIGFGLFVLGAGLFLFAYSRLLGFLEKVGFLRAPDDLRGLVVLSLAVYGVTLFFSPVEGIVSRHFERQADSMELRLTGDPETFIEVCENLSRLNKSDPDPPAFFYWLGRSHPTTVMRIKFARDWRAHGARRH
jgi:STE24 endopeptidase